MLEWWNFMRNSRWLGKQRGWENRSKKLMGGIYWSIKYSWKFFSISVYTNSHRHPSAMQVMQSITQIHVTIIFLWVQKDH
jgi:hypothetical protein